jgi:hypothetical protein
MFLGLEDHVIEGYYIWSKSRGADFGGPFTLDKYDIHHIGVRAEGNLVDTLNYHGEFVWQFMDEYEDYFGGPEKDIGGWALEAGVRWAPESMAQNEVAFGGAYTYLSGDDDPNDEDFDAYVQVADNRVFGEIADFYHGLVSNDTIDEDFGGVHIFNVDMEAALTDRLNTALEAYYFLAAEDDNYGGEDDIGFEVDAYLNYEITEDLAGMLAAGFFAPGDAAENWSRGDGDTAWFIRGGVSVNF